MNKKGIILAGGSGTRLFPSTISVNKHLLPVFDKPMIYYSLSVLMLAGIREFLIITTPRDVEGFEQLLKNGQQLGIKINYAVQEHPNGIAEAFILGEDFIGNGPIALILGDNILFGVGLGRRLQKIESDKKAIIFSYEVKNPERYGVVEIDEDGNAISIEEKPNSPKSRLAIPGLYMYPNDVVKRAHALSPSARGELEITDINKGYMDEGRLKVISLSRGYAWLDAGTEAALLDASNFISAIENRQGLRIGSVEEVAWLMGWISIVELADMARSMSSSDYGKYLQKLVDGQT